MRFTERMIGERGAVVALVQQRLLTRAAAGDQLGLTDRQVRRLVRRVEQAGGDPQALAYQRRHPAPNRLPAEVRAAVGAPAAEHPAWSAPAIGEAVEAQAVTPLPSPRTVSGWLRAERAGARGRRPPPARRFEAPGPLALVQMDTTYGQWLVGARRAYVIAMLDDYSRASTASTSPLSHGSCIGSSGGRTRLRTRPGRASPPGTFPGSNADEERPVLDPLVAAAEQPIYWGATWPAILTAAKLTPPLPGEPLIYIHAASSDESVATRSG